MTEPRVLVSGETLIDFIPETPGEIGSVETFHRRAGGAPANVAVTLATLSEPPYFWTRIGADPFGDFLARTLAEHGVPETYVERDPEAQTSLAFVAHDESAERSFSFYRDDTADTRLSADRVPEDALEAAEYVVVGGVALAEGRSRTATFTLAEKARRAGCRVLLDPNARPELWDDGEFERVIDDAINDAHLLKATPEDLAAAGYDGTPEEMARAVANRGPDTVLVTLGDDGALAYATEQSPWGERTVRHGGYEVDPVDTTGAGDAFTGGAVAALLEGGADLGSVLAFANAVAALTTTEAGAMTAVPTRDAVREFRDIG